MLYLDANALGLSSLSLGERVLTALLGYAVVFAGLLMLMALVILMGKLFQLKAARAAAHRTPIQAPAPSAHVQEKKEPEAPVAPGSAGEVKRFDVPDKEAAMIMAIVAAQMGKPLNELRFKSIKEVKDNEV